jgi:hypothetical protein
MNVYLPDVNCSLMELLPEKYSSDVIFQSYNLDNHCETLIRYSHISKYDFLRNAYGWIY